MSSNRNVALCAHAAKLPRGFTAASCFGLCQARLKLAHNDSLRYLRSRIGWPDRFITLEGFQVLEYILGRWDVARDWPLRLAPSNDEVLSIPQAKAKAFVALIGW